MAETGITNKELNTAVGDIGGAWKVHNPVFSATAGTLTTVTSNICRYTVIGKTCHMYGSFTMTNKGSATGTLMFTLPLSAYHVMAIQGGGRENYALGYQLQISGIDTTKARIRLYNDSGVIIDNYELNIWVTYEIA